MKLLIIALGFIFVTGAGAKPIHRMALRPAPDAQYDFSGIVKLTDCSGSLIRLSTSQDTDLGLVLTNGHCVAAKTPNGMMNANEFISKKQSIRHFKFLNKDGTLMNDGFFSKQLLYATITWNDIAIYLLKDTYSTLKAKFGISALTLSPDHPKAGESVEILSGFWQQGYACSIDRFIYELHEADYVSRDSIRYSATGCETIHGTSGSPVISKLTGQVIGVNSTGNDEGKPCAMDNPCEVSEDGTVFYKKGLNYADQTYLIYGCFDQKRKFDLTLPTCKLFH